MMTKYINSCVIEKFSSNEIYYNFVTKLLDTFLNF